MTFNFQHRHTEYAYRISDLQLLYWLALDHLKHVHQSRNGLIDFTGLAIMAVMQRMAMVGELLGGEDTSERNSLYMSNVLSVT